MTELFESKYGLLVEKSASFRERLKKFTEEKLPNDVTEELFAQLETLQNACEELCIQNEELVASNELVLDQESTHRRLFEYTPIPFVTTNQSANIYDANLAATKFFQIEKQFLTKKRISYYVEKKHKLKFFENLQKVNDHKVDQLEWASEIKPRDGNSVPVVLNVFRTHDATQQLHWSIQDVSHVIAAERAAQLTQLHDFIATLMHDLKVPLLGIRMVVQNLSNIDQLDDKSRENTYALLEDANNQVLNKVEELLEAYQLNAECKSTNTDIDLKSFSLNQLVDDCIDMVMAQTTNRNIALEAHIEDELQMIASRAHIQRVLICLLDNAIKHSPDNNPVRIQSYKEDNDIVIAVTDSGGGISAKDQKNLFKKFWQGKTKKSPKSSGLGLFICKQIVELHRGSIYCDYSSEEGSRFLVRIPQESGSKSNTNKI